MLSLSAGSAVGRWGGRGLAVGEDMPRWNSLGNVVRLGLAACQPRPPVSGFLSPVRLQVTQLPGCRVVPIPRRRENATIESTP